MAGAYVDLTSNWTTPFAALDVRVNATRTLSFLFQDTEAEPVLEFVGRSGLGFAQTANVRKWVGNLRFNLRWRENTFLRGHSTSLTLRTDTDILNAADLDAGIETVTNGGVTSVDLRHQVAFTDAYSFGFAMRESPANTPSLDRLQAQLKAALERRVEVLEAYLFGSRARGDEHGRSDVDIAVYIDEARADHGAWGYTADLTTDLMGVLNTNDVDVVVLNQAPPLLYHRVLRDGIRLLSRDLEATTERAGVALSRYLDFVPQMQKMDAARRFAKTNDEG